MRTKTIGLAIALILTTLLSINIGIGNASLIATINLDPDTLNLASKGKFVTAYIELPTGYDVADIDCTSLRLGMMLHSGNLLVNGGFEDGLTGWRNAFSGRGSHSATVVPNGTRLDVLEYHRWNSGADGGTCAVVQDLDILVSDYTELYVECDAKVISNSLHDSGWWSYERGGYGEWPAKVTIIYEDATGTVWNWIHAFFPSDNNERWGRTEFEYVTRNTWVHYKSPNLINVNTTLTLPYNEPVASPPPHRIIGIAVGGNGWDFKGRIDNVNLWGIQFTGIPAVSCDRPLESVIGDNDDDGVPDFMAKFDRGDLISYIMANVDMEELLEGGSMTLTIIGALSDSTSFEGSDTITVWCRPRNVGSGRVLMGR